MSDLSPQPAQWWNIDMKRLPLEHDEDQSDFSDAYAKLGKMLKAILGQPGIQMDSIKESQLHGWKPYSLPYSLLDEHKRFVMSSPSKRGRGRKGRR